MNGDTPFAIVIFDQQRTICADPGAPLSSHSCTAYKSDGPPPSVKTSLYLRCGTTGRAYDDRGKKLSS
jgi:hypothetical protein